MKKIFLGILYILFLVIIFTYSLLDCVYTKNSSGEDVLTCVLAGAAYTGISIIGFIFIFPAFVFAILALSVEKKIVTFLRDVFSFFACGFTIGGGIIVLFQNVANYYVPIILMVFAAFIFVFATVGIIKTISSEDKKNELASNDSNNENVEVVSDTQNN